jgi:hypothetical protein
MFSKNDIEEFQLKGIDTATIALQIENFKKGFPFINLSKPATYNDGICFFENGEIATFVSIFDEEIPQRDVLKFVPASGAASRMFQTLYTFRDNFKDSEKNLIAFENDKSFNSVYKFITQLTKFAFYDDLKQIMQSHHLDIDVCLQQHDFFSIISYLLDDKGLGYGNLPKALLKFHRYESVSRTAVEEHLVEAAHYAIKQDNASIHFTLSPEHIEKFNAHIEGIKYFYEEKFKLKFNITYSVQKTSTDTVAVDMDNNLFRNSNGKIIFRPAGHGALIENLNDLQGDIIFIKNIDNIVPDKLKELTYLYKKVIGGYLIHLQRITFKYLHLLKKRQLDVNKYDEIIDFAAKQLLIYFPESFHSLTEKERMDYLFTKLNRPIRICGMVKNEGEPGGGPFWVKQANGEISLQIVESSQINVNNTQQNQIFRAATHFNPVDLVCGVKDFEGKPFNLKQFVEPSTGFISIKSKDGKNLKAQELPGLWNGAMANWISIFVEVPIITFNPVKTINDLLRVEHQ